MNYGQIFNCDVANGPGMRVSLFVSGCRNKCPGCFQPETWDFNYGKPFTPEVEERILEMLKPSYISGLTVLGGDPFEFENQLEMVRFIPYVKVNYPYKNIWMYTGYTWEQLMHEKSPVNLGAVTEIILQSVDVLVDGPFVKAEKNLRLRFRGSNNQRLIDVRRSLLNPERWAIQIDQEERIG